MEKNIKLIHFPFTPPVEVVDKMVMRVSGSYSPDFVTILFNPEVQRETSSTDQSKRIKFDLVNHTHEIMFDSTTYNVRLLSIGEERIGAEAFKAFEFMVTW